jgi:hypothetical protein
MVKALKVWRHWLEGAKHPFLIWTDHRNLEYIRPARRLNPHQARWAMYFTRFRFTISYRPGSLNTKADALSRLYDTDDWSIDPTPIIPAAKLVALVVWEVDTDIERALREEPAPPQCPEGRRYVPVAVPLAVPFHKGRGPIYRWIFLQIFPCLRRTQRSWSLWNGSLSSRSVEEHAFSFTCI